MAARLEHLIVGLAPDIGPLAEAMIRLKFNVVVGHHAKRRDDVLPEIFILIIAPDEDEVRLKGVDLAADAAEGVENFRPVRPVRSNAFVIAPFLAHGLGPVGRGSFMCSGMRVAF